MVLGYKARYFTRSDFNSVGLTRSVASLAFLKEILNFINKKTFSRFNKQNKTFIHNKGKFVMLSKV
jgi:hypothetical protein